MPELDPARAAAEAKRRTEKLKAVKQTPTKRVQKPAPVVTEPAAPAEE